MNVQKLKDRIKLLEQEREQLKGNLAAYEGAIQDNKYWLSELEKNNDGQDSTQ